MPIDDNLDDPTTTFWVESLFGANTKQPLVKMTLRSQSITVSTDDARRIALNILGGISAAEHDQIVYRAAMTKLGMSPREMAKFMAMMREVRKELDDAKATADGNLTHP